MYNAHLFYTAALRRQGTIFSAPEEPQAETVGLLH